MRELLRGQVGGTLVTLDEDGCPYPTYVLVAPTDRPDIIFASFAVMQHSRNAAANERAAFLLDSREHVLGDQNRFDRLVLQGSVHRPEKGTEEYRSAFETLQKGNPESASFVSKGADVWVFRTRTLKFSPGLLPDALRRTFDD